MFWNFSIFFLFFTRLGWGWEEEIHCKGVDHLPARLHAACVRVHVTTMMSRVVLLLVATSIVCSALGPGDCCCSSPECSGQAELCGKCPSGRAAAAPLDKCPTGSWCWNEVMHSADEEATSLMPPSELNDFDCCCGKPECDGAPMCGVGCPSKRAQASDTCSTGHSCMQKSKKVKDEL